MATMSRSICPRLLLLQRDEMPKVAAYAAEEMRFRGERWLIVENAQCVGSNCRTDEIAKEANVNRIAASLDSRGAEFFVVVEATFGSHYLLVYDEHFQFAGP